MVQAFRHYASATDSAALAKLARDDKNKYWPSFGEVMRTLMEVDPKTARSIYEERFEDFPFEPWATRGLMELSAASEKSIWPLLESKNGKVREKACAILGNIGSAKSVPVLKNASGDDLDQRERSRFKFAVGAAVKQLLAKNADNPVGN